MNAAPAHVAVRVCPALQCRAAEARGKACHQEASKRDTSHNCPSGCVTQCEAANARAREFIKMQRDNRVNLFWHKDPPPDMCAMPPEGLPWRPAFEEWDLVDQP